MIWNGRLYFLSDRDGTMNLWSMARAGGGLTPAHAHIRTTTSSRPSLSDGRIAYQLGADIRVFDVAAEQDRAVPIRLVSDFDQLRERWVKTPLDWVTAAHLSPDRRPRRAHRARPGLRRARASRDGWSRPRATRRCATAMAASCPTASRCSRWRMSRGEVEFWRVPRQRRRRSRRSSPPTAKVLRWDGMPSPDGKCIAHYDKDQQLWVLRHRRRSSRRQHGRFRRRRLRRRWPGRPTAGGSPTPRPTPTR